MSRPTLALALCSVGIALMTLGAFLLAGPVALCAGGLALFVLGAFAVDVEPRAPRTKPVRTPVGNSLSPIPEQRAPRAPDTTATFS